MSKNPPAVDVKGAVLKPKTSELHEKIAKLLKIDKAGTVTNTEALFYDNLPPNLNKDLLNELQVYTSHFIPAFGLAMGEAGVNVMKKNSALDRISASVPINDKDSLGFELLRERQVSNLVEVDGKMKPDGTKSSYGALNVKVDMYSAGKVGDLRKVKEMLAAEATAAFSGS